MVKRSFAGDPPDYPLTSYLDQYAEKLSRIHAGETVAMHPMEFLRFTLERQDLSMPWLSRKMNLGDGVVRGKFNCHGQISRNWLDALVALTGKDRTFWQQRHFQSDMAQQVTFREGVDVSHTTDGVKGPHTDRLLREALEQLRTLSSGRDG